MQIEDQRYRRERSFHNWVFSEKGRASVGKFYSIANCSEDFYRECIVARSGRDVLEIGCGRGSIVPFLSRDVSLTGIDISDVAVQESAEVARANGVRGHYLLMNAEVMAFADERFDLVCGTGILHHLNLEKACAEIGRVLRPDGSAIFIEPLGHNPVINLFRKMTPQIRSVDEHPLLVKDVTVLRSHFAQVDVRYFCLLSLAAVPFRKLKIFPAVKNTLERVDRSLYRALPGCGRYAWMMVMIMSKPKGGVQ